MSVLLMKANEELNGGIHFTTECLQNIADSHNGRAVFGVIEDNTENAEGTVDLTRVSHIFTNLRIDKAGNLIADGQILENTPVGSILKKLQNAQPKLTFQYSLLGIGLSNAENAVISESYRLGSVFVKVSPVF